MVDGFCGGAIVVNAGFPKIFFYNSTIVVGGFLTLEPLHNVYMRDCDSPVYKIALYMLQGNNRISMYICRILALFP